MKLILCLLTLFLSSCSKQEGVKPAEPLKQVEKGGARILKATLKPQEKPNTYHVLLEWQLPDNADAWYVLRTEGQQTTKIIATLNGPKREYLDIETVAGQLYEYKLCTAGAPDLNIKDQVSIQIPKDMVIQDVVQVSEIRGIQRLFLNSGSLLVGVGSQTYIEVDEVISENGRITNQKPRQVAPTGSNGRHGGLIFLKANRARGNLFLEARGENGGAGLKGAPGTPGTPGPKGRDAGIKYEQSPPLIGGWVPVCNPKPTDGGPGSQGGKGAPGGVGGNGGNAARVLVQIVDPSLVNVEIQSIPGMEGERGEGGDGGIGGAGGAAGNSLPICPAVKAGPSGTPGPKGEPGQLGQKGMEQPICQILGTAKIGNCEAFSVKDGRVL